MTKKDNEKDKKKNNFLKELKSELKKVTWPTPKKLVNNTSAVIAVVLIVATIVFIFDLCFENLNKFGVERLKGLVSSETENVVENVESEEDNASTEGIELVTDEQVQETENVEATDNSEEVAQ